MMIRKYKTIVGVAVIVVLLMLSTKSNTASRFLPSFLNFSNDNYIFPRQRLKTFTCLDPLATKFGRVEDIFCTRLGMYDRRFKSPCFYDYLKNNKRKLTCLPYFYIIGPDEYGTTDLHNRLIKHPEVMDNGGIFNKEARFWSWKLFGKIDFHKWDKKRTTDFYLSLFHRTAKRLEKDKQFPNLVTGDASPMDFYDFSSWQQIPQNKGKDEPEVLVPTLIKAFHKDHSPKFLVQFRDPIERTLSLYVDHVQNTNPETFHVLVLDSIRVLDNCLAIKSRRLCFFDGDLFRRMPVKLVASCYSVFLKEWLNVFPRNSFFITRIEDTSVNMKGTLKDIFSFLELTPLVDHTLQKISGIPKQNATKANVRVAMLPKTVQLLKQFYQPYNEDLARMLQNDIFLWNDARNPTP